MNPLKAPRPDNRSITKAILHALKSCVVSSTLNYTRVVLIPKKKNLELVGDFRPISLCNVTYKIISKVISTHFKKWMPALISSSLVHLCWID